MVEIKKLFQQNKISMLNDLTIERYINFLGNSYKENLEHSFKVINDFPRWSIISGYYAMHDATKLLIAKKLRIKIDMEVHATTIAVLKEFLKDKVAINLIEKGYKEFLTLASELEEAKKERVKVQYYTGTAFLKEEYRKRAKEFNEKVVKSYLKKIEVIL